MVVDGYICIYTCLSYINPASINEAIERIFKGSEASRVLAA